MLSFVSDTRVLGLEDDNPFSDISSESMLRLDVSSICCGQLLNQYLVQVCEREVVASKFSLSENFSPEFSSVTRLLLPGRAVSACILSSIGVVVVAIVDSGCFPLDIYHFG